jgi:sec-independent protein translocase protein TatA
MSLEILYKRTIISDEVYKSERIGGFRMLSNIGAPGMILILIVALFVFGPNRLPEMGRAVGKSIREFKRASEGIQESIMKEIKEEINVDKQENK